MQLRTVFISTGSFFTMTLMVAAADYTIEPLFSMGSSGAFLMSVNDQPQVVATAYFQEPEYQAVLWDSTSGLQMLNGPAGSSMQAWDINNGGQITGGWDTQTNEHTAFIWQNGVRFDIPGEGTGLAINEAGDVVGTGFLWSSGTRTTIDGFLRDINDLGQIVGWRSTPQGNRATLWDHGAVTDLGTLGYDDQANGINNLCQIVGWSNSEAYPSGHAWYWENSVMTDIHGYWQWSRTPRINNHGQVVITTGAGGLWENGTLTPLADLLPSESPWESLRPMAINDSGQIAGQGMLSSEPGVMYAFLMTPLDPDGDGVDYPADNCPYTANPAQSDMDGDGVGDVCDPCPQDIADDSDGDGVCDSDDVCLGYDDHSDVDGDGVPNGCDLCVGNDASGDCDFDGLCDDTDPCTAPVLMSAVSRKQHAGAGYWDIDVGTGDVECRSAQLGTTDPNELLIVATFNMEVGLLGGADVLTDVGAVSVLPGATLNQLEITVTDLPLNAQVNLAFPGVAPVAVSDSAFASDSTLCMRVIVGDYDNLGRTNFLDFAKIKNGGHLNQLVDSLNRARADLDCGGRPNFLDFAKVKNAGLLNQTAPQCPMPAIGP